MKVIVADIPDEGLDVQGDAHTEVEGLAPGERAHYKAHLERSSGEVLVTGDVSVKLRLTCARCLKEYDIILKAAIDCTYAPAEQVEDSHAHELKHDELDMGFYTEGQLNMDEVAQEHVALNVPMRPLCGESCKGMCPKCGKDLNESPCGCVHGDTDPRLKVLEKYLKTRKEH